MVIAWTEAFSSFVPAGTGWQDYDIFTNKSVPKGAVAEIACANANLAAARILGVRTDGSGIARTLTPHEAEGGGATYVTMLVTVHATTGLIETYCDSTTGVTFYLTGYWTGVTFTETRIGITLNVAAVWTNYDAFTTDGIPKGSVCQIAVRNSSGSAAPSIGVRIDGSGLARYYAVHECEPGVAGSGTYYTTYVKTSVADGIFEWYTSTTTRYAYILGYFDSDMDYQELWTQSTVAADSTWEEEDLSGSLDQDGRVVNYVLTHNVGNQERLCGVRIAGGADLARMLDEHEAETNGYAGYGVTVQTSSTGVVDLYAEDASESVFMLAGYFKFTAVVSYTKEFTFDAWLQKEGTTEFTFDSWLQKEGTKEFTYDALLQKEGTKPFTFDSLLQKTLTKPFTFDSWLQKEATKPFTFDSLLTAVGSKEFTFDSWLQKSLTKPFTFDAQLQKTLTATFTFDSLLQKSFTKPFTYDAWLQKEATASFTFDAVLESAVAVATVTGMPPHHILRRLGLDPELLRLIKLYLEIKKGMR